MIIIGRQIDSANLIKTTFKEALKRMVFYRVAIVPVHRRTIVTCAPESLRRGARPTVLYRSRLVKRSALSTSTATPIEKSAAI